MRILVTVKRVLDPFTKVKPLADGSGIDTNGVKFEVNPFDEIALEEAVRLKESNVASEIVAVSVGGPECEEQLRKALAMGADRAILVEHTGPSEPRQVVDELFAVVNEVSPDLILMGKQATDDDHNQVGQMLAERLGWPQATYASKIAVAGDALTVTRETDAGSETLEMSLPCVVTADLRLNEPRYIALPGIIKARSKPLEKRPASGSTQPRLKRLRVEAPPGRAQGKRLSNVAELVAELRAKGVLG